jgi:hypothetical protein
MPMKTIFDVQFHFIVFDVIYFSVMFLDCRMLASNNTICYTRFNLFLGSTRRFLFIYFFFVLLLVLVGKGVDFFWVTWTLNIKKIRKLEFELWEASKINFPQEKNQLKKNNMKNLDEFLMKSFLSFVFLILFGKNKKHLMSKVILGNFMVALFIPRKNWSKHLLRTWGN